MSIPARGVPAPTVAKYLRQTRATFSQNYLEDALQRIDKGEYGKCSECGKVIEKERLEAVPHARQCLQCKMNLSK